MDKIGEPGDHPLAVFGMEIPKGTSPDDVFHRHTEDQGRGRICVNKDSQLVDHGDEVRGVLNKGSQLLFATHLRSRSQ